MNVSGPLPPPTFPTSGCTLSPAGWAVARLAVERHRDLLGAFACSSFRPPPGHRRCCPRRGLRRVRRCRRRPIAGRFLRLPTPHRPRPRPPGRARFRRANVARSACHHVRAGAAAHRVAAAAVEPVRAAAAVERVVASPPLSVQAPDRPQPVACHHPAGHLLHVPLYVVLLAREAVVRRAVDGHHDRCGTAAYVTSSTPSRRRRASPSLTPPAGPGPGCSIAVAGAAPEYVVPSPPLTTSLPSPPSTASTPPFADEIVVRAAGDRVGPAAAVDLVVARAAVELRSDRCLDRWRSTRRSACRCPRRRAACRCRRRPPARRRPARQSGCPGRPSHHLRGSRRGGGEAVVAVTERRREGLDRRRRCRSRCSRRRCCTRALGHARVVGDRVARQPLRVMVTVFCSLPPSTVEHAARVALGKGCGRGVRAPARAIRSGQR